MLAHTVSRASVAPVVPTPINCRAMDELPLIVSVAVAQSGFVGAHTSSDDSAMPSAEACALALQCFGMELDGMYVLLLQHSSRAVAWPCVCRPGQAARSP